MVVEIVAAGGLAVAALTLAGQAVKALWSISKHLGQSQARTEELLAHHHEKINDHEDRIRVVEGAIK